MQSPKLLSAVPAATPITYNVVDGRDAARQTLSGTGRTDEFLFDKAAGARNSADIITDFKERHKDRLALEDGGNVWWGKWLGADGSTKGYYLFSSDDSTAGDNFLARIDLRSTRFNMMEGVFQAGTTLAGPVTHDLVDLTDVFSRQRVDLNALPNGRTKGHVVVIDRSTSDTFLLGTHYPDRVWNFIDGQDKIAMVNPAGVTVHIQNGTNTGVARTVTLRTSDSISNENNVLAYIEGFTGTFDANDLTADLTVEII